MKMRTRHTKIPVGYNGSSSTRKGYSPKYQDKQIKTTATAHPRVKTNSLTIYLKVLGTQLPKQVDGEKELRTGQT